MQSKVEMKITIITIKEETGIGGVEILMMSPSVMLVIQILGYDVF